ncbi:MAG: sulfatase [Verrucomicrobia bacterium]|nr:sulfatase [Verrucomicrobiota bacterium]MDA1086067.1 sulfatase [Verrucomicrobiota bacterium]
MKAIMVMFDSLNRRMLPPYGGDWVHAPNFSRLAERTLTFDNAYIGSMPCMPARRELHTGRPNFLHRGWGPLEPFDDSMPQILKESGVYTHFATDHYHYFEDGGCTYHTKYSSWEFFRGQEGDPWIGQVADPPVPAHLGNSRRQDWVNREQMRHEEDQPQPQTFKAGIDFMHRNCNEDNWFLQIETFDPHEPFFSQRKYKDLYAKHYDEYKGDHFDWPAYGKVKESPEEVEHCRHEYAALMSMCDVYMGQVLDAMDELDLWKDTMLIVNTDHGFLLGEHDSWAKCWLPFYQELAHIPFFVWDPRCGKRGERRNSLVQTIDIAPTLLDFFGVEIPTDMLGKPLGETIATDSPVRETALFGMFGSHVNVTDGRYVYMRGAEGPEDSVPCHYTHMPTNMTQPFKTDAMSELSLAEPFSFTKGSRTMRIPGAGWYKAQKDTRLYDVQLDPLQSAPLEDPETEERMIAELVRLMKECDAPPEQYERLGLAERA